VDTPAQFEVSSERHDGACVLSVTGELDLSTHEKLSERLVAEAGKGDPVVVDLSRCAFIDSSGVRALLLGLKAGNEDGGGPVSIAAPGPQVRRILEMTGLDRELVIHESVEAALG
jgi:anti-anti-sigma factor